MVGPKNPARVINERREQVWLLMVQGENPQQIKKALKITNPTIYRDVQFLRKKSKQYIYDMAKGGGVALAYQRSIEGISFTMSQAWRKFNSDQVPEKQKPVYLRLIKDCHESLFQLTANGPGVLIMQDLTKRAERVGINLGFNFNPDVNGNNKIDTDKYESRIN